MDEKAAIEARLAPESMIATGHEGTRLSPARGLSIYFPTTLRAGYYKELGLAQGTRWAEFRRAYLES